MLMLMVRHENRLSLTILNVNNSDAFSSAGNSMKLPVFYGFAVNEMVTVAIYELNYALKWCRKFLVNKSNFWDIVRLFFKFYCVNNRNNYFMRQFCAAGIVESNVMQNKTKTTDGRRECAYLFFICTLCKIGKLILQLFYR